MLSEANISIIIPTRNRPQFLREAVDSVLNQTLITKEIIIIDDCSYAECHDEILKIGESHDSIQLHQLKAQKGVSFCRNFGLEVATGEFVLFLDDDDTLNATMLEKSIENMANYDVVSCRIHAFLDRQNQELKKYNWQETALLDIYEMEYNPAAHIFLYHPMIHSFLFRKSVFDQTRFPEDISYGEDFYVWLSLAFSGFQFRKLDFIGGNCRVHEFNQSSRTSTSDKIKFYKKILNEFLLGVEMKNLAYLKMMLVLFKARDPRCFLYFIKSLYNPILIFRHLKHFWNVYS